LVINIVAKSSFGLESKFWISFDCLSFDFFKSSFSAGFKEKNADSDPDINAEINNKKAIIAK
jgi:hypothetical protein